MNQVSTIPSSGYPFCVNSRLREQPNDSPFNFTARFNSGTGANADTYYSVVLKSIIFQNRIPNVTPYNNVASIKYNGTMYSTIFEPGNYDALSFVDAVNEWLHTIDTDLTFGYDTVSKFGSITIPANSTFEWSTGVDGLSTAPDTWAFEERSTQHRFIDMIGFWDFPTPQLFRTGSLAETFSGYTQLDLYGTAFVDVCLNTNLGSIHMGTKNYQILARVPIKESFGQVVHYEPSLDHTFLLDGNALNNLRVTLYDEWTNVVDTVPLNTTFALNLVLYPSNENN